MEDQNKQPISGYVFNVSPLKVSKAKRTFWNTEFYQSITNCLFAYWEHCYRWWTSIGCELVNFKKPDNGDLLVTNFTSVKRVKLNFEKPSLIVSYSTVSEIVNEKPIYAMINVKGTIFNFEETVQNVCKNDKMLQLRKVVFKDSTECLAITFFDKNVSKISEQRVTK